MSDTPLVETVCEDARWNEDSLGALAEQAARQTLGHLGLAPAGFEIALLACDDARIATLNAQFRDKAAPTNVLSWPAWDLCASEDGGLPDLPDAGPPEAPEPLGDIALAYETVRREAEAQGKAFTDHITHLIVHSVLHLLGYDHIRDKDAALMEETECRILAQLGVADPYDEGAEMPR